MEPSLIGWEWVPYGIFFEEDRGMPQWSPALSAGNGRSIHNACTSRRCSRNGAQPYRLGMGGRTGLGA